MGGIRAFRHERHPQRRGTFATEPVAPRRRVAVIGVGGGLGGPPFIHAPASAAVDRFVHHLAGPAEVGPLVADELDDLDGVAVGGTG